MSNGVNADHPVGNGVTAMTECLTEKSDGDAAHRLLGRRARRRPQATQALRSGTQEMVVTSSSPLVGHPARARRLRPAVPLRQREEADAVLDGEFGDYVSDRCCRSSA
jgi:TRAP-type transport system periplasmic protein